MSTEQKQIEETVAPQATRLLALMYMPSYLDLSKGILKSGEHDTVEAIELKRKAMMNKYLANI